MLEIREALNEDREQIWEIIESVIATGDSYVFSPDSSKEKMLAYWCAADKKTYVALLPGSDVFASHLNKKIVGTFYLKDNQPDLGSHVANAGYMVLPPARGKKVGKTMAEFSLAEAKRLGYKAMQFNLVVKSNEVAVKLWLSLGFEIIGEIPDAFNHLNRGLTDAYIMYRKL